MCQCDIVNFTNDTFKIKKEDAFTDQNENKEVSRHHASSDNRVSQNTPSVNNDSMQNLDNDAPKQKLSVKASAETLSELKAERAEAAEEYRELRAKSDEIKSSAE